jgi:tartrate-resistant acid phosphatase type 5
MKHKFPSLLICAAITFCLTIAACAQQGAGHDSLVNQLPAALREQGTAILNAKDDKVRTQLTDDLARQQPAAALQFLIGILDTDPAASVRRAIITRLGSRPETQLQQALERHAASDANVDVALLALNRLRQQRMIQLRQSLMKRLEAAQQSGNQADLQKLLQEQERWISLVNGTMLPAFMRVPPPLFALKAKGKTLRVITLGDFGAGAPENGQIAGEPQKQVAAAMLKAQKAKGFDFGITLGDNFYPTGMFSPTDARWKTLWSDLYDPLKLKFYVTFGNHDWGSADSPAAELMYENPSWILPAPYYTFTAGPVQFFALDTNEVSELQLTWLRDELAKSTARWKIVYGHHPIYSAGQHGDGKILIARLLPVLKDRADIFFAGHEHDMQHLKAEGDVHFFINGGGGAKIRETNIKADPRIVFAKSAYGFSTLEADNDKIVVKFIGVDSAELYQYTVTKAKRDSVAATTK